MMRAVKGEIGYGVKTKLKNLAFRCSKQIDI